jgi:hypothetical protein
MTPRANARLRGLGAYVLAVVIACALYWVIVQFRGR